MDKCKPLIIGPGAIPFRICALENVRVLMRYGVTFGAMLAVSRCSVEPMPCQREYMVAAGLMPPPVGRAYGTHTPFPTPHTRSGSRGRKLHMARRTLCNGSYTTRTRTARVIPCCSGGKFECGSSYPSVKCMVTTGALFNTSSSGDRFNLHRHTMLHYLEAISLS